MNNIIQIEDSTGKIVMVDIIHPETRKVIIHSGTMMNTQLIEVCMSEGVDHIITQPTD